MIVNGIERNYIIHDENSVKGFFGEYRYLSNFEVCDVWFDGNLYGSSESAYMSAKTLDFILREKFTKQSGIIPKEAKKLGREIPLRSDWEEVKYEVMASVVFDKFYRNKELRNKLLSTGNKYLEETNHWKDVYWGVCDGVGENNLGKLLMSIRSFWKPKKYTNDGKEIIWAFIGERREGNGERNKSII